MALELGERWPAWHPDVRRAVWDPGGMEQDVLAVLGPHTPGAVQLARDGATQAMSYRGKHVLPLLAVAPTGREVAWLYPFEVVVAVGRLPLGTLGPRAAAEVVRDVVRALRDHAHPGPSTDDVLLDQHGCVRIANFVGPLTAVVEAPGTGLPGAGRVFRVGVLLTTLLGSAWQPAAGAIDHEAAIRRVLIDAMSAPGAVFDEPYRALVRDVLAWDPRDRPETGALLHRLDELVRTTGGPRLADVARTQFGNWMMPYRSQAPLELDLPDFNDTDHGTVEVVTHSTLDGEHELGDLGVEDDPTVDSELGVVPGSDRTPTSALEFGSLPLRVGPPPEEAGRPTPRLPDGFLGGPRPPDDPRVASANAPSWLTWLGVFLCVLALGMASWLAFG